MRRFIASIVGLVAIASTAQAAPNSGGQEAQLGLYVGDFSALRDSKHEAVTGGAEYRFRDVYHGVRPTVGAFAAGGGEVYTYAGINWDLPLNTAPIYLTPGFDVGYYHSNNEKRLGYAMEFRSTMEVAYQFQNHQRVGVAISHLSNAGLGNKNPGTETVQAVYVAPLW